MSGDICDRCGKTFAGYIPFFPDDMPLCDDCQDYLAEKYEPGDDYE